MLKIQNKKFDEERTLYALKNATLENCIFDGPADGESALKETADLTLTNCVFHLRYPLWHCHNFTLDDCEFSSTARAAMWYDEGGIFRRCTLQGIKAFRECSDIHISDCKVDSPEFGWFCHNMTLDSCTVQAEYLFLKSDKLHLDNVNFEGKYSFQYVADSVVQNSVLVTKDAFWHAHNVTVKNCRVVGEYLGWYSDGLTLENCDIYGTQPLCYCKNLTLKNCTMHGCDLAFEKSEVVAQINGSVMSVKNPLKGKITADSIGELVLDKGYENACEIVTKKQI